MGISSFLFLNKTLHCGFSLEGLQLGAPNKHNIIVDIQIFGMNMTFISLSEAKNLYFTSGKATNEIYIFSLHEKK